MNPPRPTIYRGIPMRSRLEATVAAWLDAHHLAWEYEPVCFADEKGQYLPDFRVQPVDVLGDLAALYIEVKPALADLGGAWNRMQSIYASEPTAALTIQSPNDATFHTFAVEVGQTRMDGCVWVTCRACGTTRIAIDEDFGRPYTEPDPRCRCGEVAASVETIWLSEQYYSTVHGLRLAPTPKGPLGA